MQKEMRIIRSCAPIRICDLGGWTDTWFAKFGTVLNIAVTPAVEIQIRPRQESGIEVLAENFNYRFEYKLGQPSKHPLIDACIERSKLSPELGLNISIFSKVPGGASTGTSAALGVALLSALQRVKSNTELPPTMLASEAHAVETEMLGQQSGIQDQLAAAFGGVNLIEMTDYPHSKVTQLHLSEAMWRELETRLVLIYLGKPHSSSEVHQKVIHDLKGIGPTDTRLQGLRDAAKSGANAIAAEDLSKLGEAMLINTENQAALHRDLISPTAGKIFSIAQKHLALGWKVNGAGGDGGSVTILCGADLTSRRRMIAEVLGEIPGASEIPVALARCGACSWTT